MFKVVDYSGVYDSIMQFNKNKTVSIHQWYPFVEGYSKEFIVSILDEIPYDPICVLEPFSGSGTTSLELQFLNIKCVSFEVSPFMHLLSSVKLNKDYTVSGLQKNLKSLKKNLMDVPLDIRSIEKIPFGRTVLKKDNLTKWNFNDDVIDGILDIKNSISKVKNKTYKNIFRIGLASILLDVSNLYRNGKCLSYKKEWQEKVNFGRKEVHDIFLGKLENIIAKDIEKIEGNFNNITVSNLENLHFGDVRVNIRKMADNSADLIITSPPYLNSRDYTDIYMLELKVLDLIPDYLELQKLRKQTIRSHVQVKYENLEQLNLPTLNEYLEKIQHSNINLWNDDLINMIKGYFLDMDFLFSEFKRVLIPEKYIYFNVANSAYFGEVIKVDEIICELASKRGFEVVEIRKARNLKASSQQSNSIKSLRESVIVLKS